MEQKRAFLFFSLAMMVRRFMILRILGRHPLLSVYETNHLSFYYSLIWATTEVMNQITAFRYKIRGQNIILYPRLIPAFADLKKGRELLHIVVLDFQGSMAEFSREAKQVSEQQKSYSPAALADYVEDVLIQVSCLPWLSFTNLGFERSHNADDSVPKVTWWKYEQIGEKCAYPMGFR